MNSNDDTAVSMEHLHEVYFRLVHEAVMTHIGHRPELRALDAQLGDRRPKIREEHRKSVNRLIEQACAHSTDESHPPEWTQADPVLLWLVLDRVACGFQVIDEFRSRYSTIPWPASPELFAVRLLLQKIPRFFSDPSSLPH